MAQMRSVATSAFQSLSEVKRTCRGRAKGAEFDPKAVNSRRINYSAAEAVCMAASIVGDRCTPWRSNSRWIALTARSRGRVRVAASKRGRDAGSLAGEPTLWDLAQKCVRACIARNVPTSSEYVVEPFGN